MKKEPEAAKLFLAGILLLLAALACPPWEGSFLPFPWGWRF